QGDLISMKSRDRMLEIMRRTVNNSLLPASLGEGATISHKTGDIGSAVGDTGLVDLPNGKRYAIAAIVKRPHNDDRAYDLIVRMGGVIYDYLNHAGAPATPPAAEVAPATPNQTTAPAPQQVAPPAEATIPSTPIPNSR
ncbi:MAG TPA: serine hydrolase, partial [Allocoleopsis sp.]